MPYKKNEFAVIGLGRFGSAVALTLEEHGHYVLGIDDRIEIVQSLSTQLTHVVALDATDEEALKSLDIASFQTIIVAVGTDFESNLLTSVALKNLGVKNVVCKTMSQRQKEILLKVGVDRVVLPEFEAGQRLAEELINPSLIERFSLGPGFSIAEFEAPKQFINQSLAQSNVRSRYGINIIVVKRGQDLHTSPRADFILLERDELVVLASDKRIEDFAHLNDQ